MGKHNVRTAKYDGLANALDRSGVRGLSKAGSDYYSAPGRLSDDELRGMFNGNGIGRTVIERVVSDATRKGFTTGNDALDEKFEELGGGKIFADAMTWGRLFGGAIMVMIVNDGAQTLQEPLRSGNVKSVDGLRVYDRVHASVDSWYDDETQANYGEPRMYRVASDTTYLVHESRVIRFDGIRTDYQTYKNNGSWHSSAMQPVYEAIIDYLSILSSGKSIMKEFIIGVLKMRNLMQLSQTDKGSETILKRLGVVDTTKGNENTVVVDSENEDYSKHISSISGFNEVLEGMAGYLSGCCAPMMPQTLLFGRSPSGQNATGESDLRLWYDSVASFQENEYKPKLKKLFDLLTDGEYEIEFTPLVQLTEEEEAKVYETRSKGDVAYVNAGVYDAEEIARHREDVPLMSNRVLEPADEDSED